MSRNEGMGAPSPWPGMASKVARCRSILSSDSSSEAGASSPYMASMLKLTWASKTARGIGLKESRLTVCCCSSSMPGAPCSLAGKDLDHRTPDGVLGVKAPQEERQRDGRRMGDHVNVGGIRQVFRLRLNEWGAQARVGPLFGGVGEVDHRWVVLRHGRAVIPKQVERLAAGGWRPRENHGPRASEILGI